jgi:hypothetical protein
MLNDIDQILVNKGAKGHVFCHHLEYMLDELRMKRMTLLSLKRQQIESVKLPTERNIEGMIPVENLYALL